MAIKSLINKFRKKFEWEGANFRELLTNVFSRGHKTIEERVLQDTFVDWKKQEKKLGPINFPPVENFLSSNAKLVRVGQVNGQEVSNTLKQNIMNDLRKAIEEGMQTGQLINDDVMAKFKENLRGTFSEYTEKDGLTAGKLETIALTESRGIVNNMKYDYAETLQHNNPDLLIEKEWKHYPWKSKDPREGHAEKNKEKLRIDELYKVRYYVKKAGIQIVKGVDFMKFPHDPEGGKRQNINCHCDIRFTIRRKKK